MSFLNQEDKGELTCEASNSLGVIRKSFQITLKGDPTSTGPYFASSLA
ncbi:hypothetical protein BIW11_03041 [Tropilaelaps mercedesae]|uniref:Uncharacterized protein n=1 Tax=Tropilaelaps mercedesae TaxID=418985 RepID=A0A1V9XT54_9ACAR|nr:hypothetical protein BIW11_03041 [Tropilaelaps mercedesae]